MKMRSPTSSDLDHQTIASRIDFRGMDDDSIHDILNGYEDVPTNPKPIRLLLTKAERATIWHSITSGELARARQDGFEDAIARAAKAEAWTASVCAYENMIAMLGDLGDERDLTYVRDELLQHRFRVVDTRGNVIARVTARDEIDTVHRLIDAYDAGVEAGRADAKAAMRSALRL